MTAFNIFLVLILVVCVLLMVVVLAQNPKGGGLSSAFGGNTQVVGGVKKTGDFLDNSTWTFATLLIVLILVANTLLMGQSVTSSDSKLLEGINTSAPLPTTANPLTTPPSTATPTEN
ncbi:MAG: preprotein translocase subunit SecG [Capnocytophaga sp.]|nr:preprotein translocase subunit SecG [Capnocytophaga sp.]